MVKVVDIGNFTRAGEILAMTQSGISHNIASLESELRITLLNRGRNGISLTDSGERIIKNMRNLKRRGREHVLIHLFKACSL
ncbi:LysR family transcriptional regulator [Lysinibacillus fusiformis]|uniref:LysR family transcriptional regulator n=1 Tax=Lysinibacillus fusiformis TaxID=28031 RepID=UPI00355604C0